MGAIMGALEHHGFSNDTIIFFTSDNGPYQEKAGTVPAARMWMGGDSRAVRVSCSKVVCVCLEQSCGQDISKLARSQTLW